MEAIEAYPINRKFDFFAQNRFNKNAIGTTKN